MNRRAEPSALANEFYNGLATWIAALIAVSLAPIPASLIHGLTTTLIAAGVSLGVVWFARHAEPGDLEPPSRSRTVGFSLLAAVSMALVTVGRDAGIGGVDTAAVWPFVIGLAATMTVLTPLLGWRALPVPLAAVIGGVAALTAGLAVGTTSAVVLSCQCLAPGAMIGGAAAVLMRRARELANDAATAVMGEESR